MARDIRWQLLFDWDFNGVFTDDESDYLISAVGDERITPRGQSVLGSRGIVPSMTLTLHNPGGRFSPLDTGGTLYANIKDGGGYHAPVKLNISIDGGINYYTVFQGVAKLPRENGLAPRNSPQVIIECRGIEEKILSKRISTRNADFTAWHDGGYNEEEIIAEILKDAGLTDGTDFQSQAYTEANGGTATLDHGLFVIPWAWLDDESPIEECWDIAAACGGRFYAKPDGKYYYENAQHWLINNTSSTETLTEASYGGPLRAEYNDTNLYKSVIVDAQPRALGEVEVIWEPEEIIVVPGGKTITVTARLRQPVYAVTGVNFTPVTAGGVNLNAASSVVTATLPVDAQRAQRIEITFENTDTTKTAFLRNMAIVGRPVYGEPTIEEERSSGDSFWTAREGRTRRFSGNPYIQTRAHAAFISELLRDSQENPLLTFSVPNVPGDPERELGARVTLNDSSVMSSEVDAYITAINWTLGRDVGYKQNLTLIESDRMFPYDSGDYFIVGTSTWGGSDRVYY